MGEAGEAVRRRAKKSRARERKRGPIVLLPGGYGAGKNMARFQKAMSELCDQIEEGRKMDAMLMSYYPDWSKK